MAELDFTPEEQAAMDADQAAEHAPLEPPPETPPPETSPPESTEPPPIPYAVVREERDKRQALEGQLEATRQNVQNLQGMFNQLMEKVGQPVPETEPEAPSWEDDPDGYTAHTLTQMNKRLQAMEQGQQQQVKQTEAQTADQRFHNAYRSAADQFTQSTPDFQDAYAYATEILDQDLQHRGFHDPRQRLDILHQEERSMVARAFDQGMNPADLIYKYATFRGFQPGSAKSSAGSAQSSAPGTTQLETINQGQSHQALPQGGSDAEPGISLERLAEADGEEFDKLWHDAQKRGMLG